MMKFNCEQCGACCKMAIHVVKYLPMLAAIMQPDINGCCQHLRKVDGKYVCAIYEDRPKLCNVAWMAKQRSKASGMSVKHYYKINKDACKKLQNLTKEI